MVKLPKLKCNRCGYQWTPRVEHTKICPGCRSAYWDSPRVNKPGAGRPKKNKKI